MTYAHASLLMLISMCLFSTLGQAQPTAHRLEAIIFDCDGVLVDTEYLKFLALKEALKPYGIDFSLEEYLPLVGHSGQYIYSTIGKAHGVKLPSEIRAECKRIYYAMQAEGVPAIAPAVLFAERLSRERVALGIKLGLASSAPRPEIFTNLRQVGLEEAFDLVVSGEDDLESYQDAEGKNKPKPYIYLEAAKRLAVLPENCLVFEDTTAGVDAATAAGMMVIAVPNRFTQSHDFSKAAVVIDSLTQLEIAQLFEMVEKRN